MPLVVESGAVSFHQARVLKKSRAKVFFSLSMIFFKPQNYSFFQNFLLFLTMKTLLWTEYSFFSHDY